MADTLPEGTDHASPGAAQNSAREKLKSEAADLRDRVASKASELKGQAGDKAMDFAEQGKARATDAMSEVARLIGESASSFEEKLGATYGGYARRAADAMSGAADTLRSKDIDELLEDARDLVRKSPAIAIGAAAAAGFVLARMIKAGSDSLQDVARDISSKDKDKTDPVADPVADAVTKAARKGPAKGRATKSSSND